MELSTQNNSPILVAPIILNKNLTLHQETQSSKKHASTNNQYIWSYCRTITLHPSPKTSTVFHVSHNAKYLLGNNTTFPLNGLSPAKESVSSKQTHHQAQRQIQLTTPTTNFFCIPSDLLFSARICSTDFPEFSSIAVTSALFLSNSSRISNCW